MISLVYYGNVAKYQISKKTFTHIDVVTKVFNFLNSKKGKIPNEYMKNQLKGLRQL